MSEIQNWIDPSWKLPPLRKGNHSSPDEGLCAMEMVAFIERLPHSDRPKCVCPVIGEFVRGVNDLLDFDDRQALMPILWRLPGTVSVAHELARAEYFANVAMWKFASKASTGSAAWAAASSAAESAAAARSDARYVTWSARYAARSAWYAKTPVTEILPGLDGVLAIGPRSKGFSQPVPVKELEALCA